MNTIKLPLLIVALSLLGASGAIAQQDEKALTILDEMSKKYQAMPGFRAKFKWQLSSSAEEINDSFSGEVTVKKEMYRLDLGDQEIFNNQTTVWTYLKEENEVTVTDYEPDPEELTITQIYSLYKDGYKYMFVEELTEDGKAFQVIDLAPDDKELNFFRIRLKIYKEDATIKSWEIHEKNGRKYLYTIEEFKPNVEVDDQYFVFDPSSHPGVEVVDLR